jgi:hypothetical protein
MKIATNHRLVAVAASVVLALLLSVPGCSSAGSPQGAADAEATQNGTCTPGQQLACACPGGGAGAQRCNADGRSFGECLGCPENDGSAGADAALSSGVDATAPDGSSGDAAPGLALDSGDDGASTSAGPGPDGGAEMIGCTAGTGAACLAPACAVGQTTTITGTVYDPAGLNPVYNAVVYVPSAPLQPLPPGVSCQSCDSWYSGAPVASAVTDASGGFTIQNAPWGDMTLVVQLGKWRKAYALQNVAACTANPVAQKLLLPSKGDPTDPSVSLPDIAISTGGADSLECLLARMGIDPSEFVGGASTSGHIHIFTGYNGATAPGPTPASYAALWNSKADIEKYDAVLLSCEGRETTDANNQAITPADQSVLQQYANDGGRVFASHFHYSWFDSGPFATPALASWNTGTQDISANGTTTQPGAVVQKLSNGQPFPEGAALQTWLQNVGALDGSGLLQINYAKHNVQSTNSPPVQPWINITQNNGIAPGSSQYFSFDTGTTPQGGACGRVVYSDMHVSGGPSVSTGGVPADYPGFNFGGVVPSGCASHPLTPQEKALEFMIFDLNSCLVPPGQNPVAPALPTGGTDAGTPVGRPDGGSEAGSEGPLQLGAPTFSPPSGTPPLSVTINPPAGAPTGMFLLYTTDGSLPTHNSTAYSGPIQVTSGPIVFHAFAVAAGYLDSPIATASYGP